MKLTGSLFYDEERATEHTMKILHLINDSITQLPKQIIDIQSGNNEVTVIELSKKEVSYESIIDDIFSHDRVVSW